MNIKGASSKITHCLPISVTENSSKETIWRRLCYEKKELIKAPYEGINTINDLYNSCFQKCADLSLLVTRDTSASGEKDPDCWKAYR